MPPTAVAVTNRANAQSSAPETGKVDEETVDIDLSQAVGNSGNPAMQLSNIDVEYDGKSVTGLAATIQHAAGHVSLDITTIVDALKYNTFEFRIKFDTPDEALHGFGIRMFSGPSGQWSQTSSPRHATKLPDGSYLFSWDVLNKPDQEYGINLDLLHKIAILYDNSLIPEGKEVVMTVSDMKFISGREVKVGDSARWKQWQKHIAKYEPDYSDSSSALQPPLTGRIATPISLTKDGQALGEIVVGDSNAKVEANAAKELQHWIKEISGAELPIVNTATEAKNTKVFIGRSFAEASYPKDIATLDGSDGYAVRTSGNSVYIFGAKPKGTMNGVFTFIENNSDLIWARPHPDYGTIFSKNPNFSVVWGDACDRPVGVNRGQFWGTGGWDGRDGLWSNRNRNNYTSGAAERNIQWGDRVEAGGGHNLQTLIPKDDPKYYPTIKGAKPETLSIWHHQICMSVPGLAHTMAEKVVEAVKAQPHKLDVFNVKIEDNWGLCECADCTAPISLPDGGTLTINDPEFRSTQFYKLLNDITKEVNETYPDLKIQTYAYFFTAVAPKVKLNPNIAILFCPYVRKDHRTPLYSPANDYWWQQLTAFAKQTPGVFIREYYGIHNYGRPLAEVVAEDFKTYVEMGVKSLGAETFTDFRGIWWDGAIRGNGDEFDLNMMDYWILNRIYWNPNVDVEALRKYFIRRTFHEAAPQMEKFFGVIRKKWYESIRPPSDWGNFPRMIEQSVVIPGREDEMREYLAQAATAATHPVSRILINRLEKWFSKTISQIQNPVPEDDKRTPMTSLKYGWDCNTGTNIYLTDIEFKGRFIPALHVTAKHPLSPYGFDWVCDFPHDLTGQKLKYTIIPKNPGDTIIPPLLGFLGKVGGKGNSVPAEAYTESSVAPGALQFEWAPDGLDDAKQPLDITQGGTLKFFLDRNNHDIHKVVPPEGLEFYIIDFDLVPAK